MAGDLSSINLIAAAGIIGNIGGVPIAANSTAITNISTYNQLGVVTQFANVKLTGNSVLSSSVVLSLENLASNIFPVVTNAVPSDYISSLGNTPVTGFTGLISAEISNIMGSGDLGKFTQVFNSADAYRITTNQLINSTVNANNAAATATYSTQNNTMTAGLSQISLATDAFGRDLAALGYVIDLSNLPNFGSPQGLLTQIYTRSGGSTVFNTALLNAGVDLSVLSTDTPMTDEQQRIVFEVMSTVTGNLLAQILSVLKVTTPNITVLTDLLNPVKLFPESFNTLTAPTINGLRGIYINSSGAVNSNLETTLPSNVLTPLQGYQTVQNTYVQLKKIVPPSWALASKAIQAGLEQIKSIFDSSTPALSVATAGLETNKGLDLINSLSSPLPADVSNYFRNTYSTGTGTNGTVLLADVIGSAGGWVVNGNVATATNVLSSMTSAGTLTTLTNGTTGVFTVMQNVINGTYGDIANAITIPGGLPGAGNYSDGNVAFTGPGTPGTGLIPAAYSLIGNIVSNNTANVNIANSAWSNIASQLELEAQLQNSADIVFANLISNFSVTSLATSIGENGLDTSAGGAAWFFESVANTSTQGGQAIISSMREARNQVRLQQAGIGTDIQVDNTGVEPQTSLSSGQYTVAEAVSQKII